MGKCVRSESSSLILRVVERIGSPFECPRPRLSPHSLVMGPGVEVKHIGTDLSYIGF